MYEIVYEIYLDLLGFMYAETFPELFFQTFVGLISVGIVLYVLDLTFYTIRLLSKGI